jgi:aminoglycoside/choline kinase family phosphotransferase
MTDRYQQLLAWARGVLGTAAFDIRPASSDASFRRYWRVFHDGVTRIIMDAPPDKEDCGPFIDISRRLLSAGLNAPEVLAEDLDNGFLLLTDLGTELYLDCLSGDNVDRLYGDAIERLLVMQRRAQVERLPPYDRDLLMREMALFRDWLVARELNLELKPAQEEMLDGAFRWLADAALSQPQVFVHRDYHSRNLLRTQDNNPGILDFQDAVLGPVTYDLVSLLRDCYVRWEPARIGDWALGYHRHACESGLLPGVTSAEFIRWFDLMGVQRHLKASGIFARLWRRDGKPGYLKDVPRTLNYILEVGPRYPELLPLHEFIRGQVVPALERKGLS